MKDNRIEELFRDGLQNSESDVPAGTWKAIENSLDSMMPSAGAASQSAGSLGTLGKAIIGGVIVSGIALTVYFFNTEKSEPVIEPAVQVEVATEAKVEENVKAEVAIQNLKPTSVKTESVVSNTDKEEIFSHEAFTSKDEIKPLADQSESINNKAPAAEALPELKEPVTEKIISETVVNKSDEPIPDNYSDQLNISSEQLIAEASLLPEVSFNDVITPNLDNVNDIFRVEGNEAVASFTVSVMNLNGKVIHQWSAPNGFWDGRLENGQMAPSGKYLVDIFVQPLKGVPYHKPVTIQLIR